MAYQPSDWGAAVVRLVNLAMAGALPASRTRSSTFTSGMAGESDLQKTVTTAAVKAMDADSSALFREVKNTGSVTVFRGVSSAVTITSGYPILPGEAFQVPDDAEVWLVAASGSTVVGRARS